MNEIHNSKNVVTARINADGNVIVGDGNNVTVINLKEAAQYKDIESEIQELNERFDKAKQKSIQYPDDPDFAVDLINIDSKMSERRKELETLKQEVIKLAEDFARIPINSERLKKAKAHFERGEFAEARAVLDAEKMGQELDALLEQKETLNVKTQENQQNLSDKANEYLILARLTATDFELSARFEKTLEYFEQSLRAERNVESILAYAKFLNEHNQFNQAQPFYEEALEIYRRLNKETPYAYLSEMVNSLNYLASLYSLKEEYSQAKSLFEEALLISRQLMESNHAEYLPQMAVTLNNFANLYNNIKEYNHAKLLYEEAALIYISLNEGTPKRYMDKFALNLINLGNLYSNINEYSQAYTTYEKALNIFRLFDILMPDAFLSNLGMALNNFAALLLKKNEYSEAQTMFEEALKISRRLVEKNPKAYYPQLYLTE